ncbi:hypothetical protein [Xanthomonas sacchari]|nr:hypothetical protein [Xanthomonas sacchari]
MRRWNCRPMRPRAIKRAYALRLKKTRPDDDPVAFQQLYATYRAALAWAEAPTWPQHARATIDDLQVDVSLVPPAAVPPLVVGPWPISCTPRC